MMQTQNTLQAPVLMLSLVTGLGAAMWTLEPGKAMAWAIAIFFLPVVWLAIEWRFRGASEEKTESLANIRWSITGGGLMIATPLAIALIYRLGLADFAPETLKERALGIFFGLVLAAYGNFVPKRPVPVDGADCSPRFNQAFTRLAGRIFMITGILYGGIWAFAPATIMQPVAIGALILGMALILVRAGRALLQRPRT